VEEVEFLRGAPVEYYPAHFRGRRDELNAFTSDQFVTWREAKLKENGIGKVIPDSDTVTLAYRRAVAIDEFRKIQQAALPQVTKYVANLKAPANLKCRMGLARNPFPFVGPGAWTAVTESALTFAMPRNLQLDWVIGALSERKFS
jgi:hypothetical protein